MTDLNAELHRRFGDRTVAGRPFLETFRECMVASGTTVAADKVLARAAKAAELAALLEGAATGGGAVAEAGVWRGFSARLMALVMARHRPQWRGEDLVLIDSFEGLSTPRPEDATDTADGPMVVRHATNFASGVEVVRNTLAGFPAVEIHAGWIPAVFSELPERRYRFVHLDTDLFEPTAASLAYFSRRMLPGGLIADDDYGSERFPGVRRAWDRFTQGANGRFEVRETGQCVWTAGD